VITVYYVQKYLNGKNKRFKEDRQLLEDDARTGCPSTSSTDANIAKIRDLLLTDLLRHLTCRMIAEEVNMVKTIVHDS